MSEKDRGVLGAWEERVTAKERECIWPGPRPMDQDDIEEGRILHGRDMDLARLCQRLEADYLLVLHGDSGVGKTTFLNLGLTEALPGAAFQPYLLSTWPSLGEAETFDHYLRERFLSTFGPDMSDTRKAELKEFGVAGLLSRFSGRPVLVLDQFEEFLRDSGWIGLEQFSRWLEATNRDIKLRIVISLRSEHLYKLDAVLERVRKFSLSVLPLGPITDRNVIAEIIGHPTNRNDILTISDDVTALLADCFAASANVRDSFWLLRLQAILYSLYWHAGGTPTRVDITRETFTTWVESVKKYVTGPLPEPLARFMEGGTWSLDDDSESGTQPAQEQSERGTKVATWLADAGFIRATEMKLMHCQDEADQIEGLPAQFITPLARDQLRRALPLLATGSFKERIDLLELFKGTYAGELGRLKSAGMALDNLAPHAQVDESAQIDDPFVVAGAQVTDATLDELFDQLWSLASGQNLEDHDDLLSVTREAIVAVTSVDKAERQRRRHQMIRDQRVLLQVDHVPWIEDGGSITSGPMMAARPVEVIAEMMRCFVFAAKWLQRSLICRIPTRQIQLVHDGFGPALTQWARTATQPAEAEIAGFVSLVGERKDWKKDALDAPLTTFVGKSRLCFANLRWQSCQIENAHFSHVVFANCDFRNTRFEACTFTGVVFVNCLLDGVMLSACTIQGGAPVAAFAKAISNKSARADIEAGGIPSFIIDDAPAATIATLKHFRGVFDLDTDQTTDSPSDLLYSPTSGVGAMVVRRRPDGVGEVPDTEQGLVILGSRVSHFMLRDTTFQDAHQGDQSTAGLIMAFVSGSAVDLVEQNELSLAVRSCALRGLSVSRRVTRGANRFVEIPKDAFIISVIDSLLVNTWFGDLLRGKVTISESKVFGLASLPHPADLVISLAPSCRVGLVDNASTAGCRTLSLGGEDGWTRTDNEDLKMWGWPFTGEEKFRLWRRDDKDDLAQVSRKTDYRNRGAEYELERRADLRGRQAKKRGSASTGGSPQSETNNG